MLPLLREPQGLSFDQLKISVGWMNFPIFNYEVTTRRFAGNLKLSSADRQPGGSFIDRLGQEWIDQINARLFLAIARDDLNE